VGLEVGEKATDGAEVVEGELGHGRTPP
jgi:hypothetical protein